MIKNKTIRNESIKLPYGRSYVELNLGDYNFQVIKPLAETKGFDEDDLIKNALDKPVSHINYKFFKAKSIAIAINDPTRPVPHAKILPLFADYLISYGVKKTNIKFYIATGTHQPVDITKNQTISPEKFWREYTAITHDCDNNENLKFIGNTEKNTPVYINREYYESDVKIVIGNIEPHHFMGYSGGVKTAAIGLAGRKTIQENHAMLTHSNAKMGLFRSNPMRQDVEEIGKMIGIDYALNIVINTDNRIINCFWGDPYEVVNKGIKTIEDKIQINIQGLRNYFDLVIASAGGYPKDINLYQSQKAITHACLFSKEHAPIILIAECIEGPGSEKFEHFFENKDSFIQVIDHFCSQPFEIGPHKAFQLALQGRDHPIILVSSMRKNIVNKFFLRSENKVKDALNEALSLVGKDPQIAVLPYATHTLPKIVDR